MNTRTVRENLPQGGQITLRPTLPSFNTRYDRPLTKSQGQSFSIPKKAFLSGSARDVKSSLNLPTGFKELIHPEGDIYYFDQSRRLVTPSDPRPTSRGRTLDLSYQQILERLGRSESLPASSELFVTVQQNRPFEVEYYIVDHQERVIYWLEDLDAQSLGLGPFESDPDLRGALTSEYWVHVDYFPGHRDIDLQAESDLIAILGHGCIDDMTAPGSTFPWSAEECRQFIQVLHNFQCNEQLGGCYCAENDLYCSTLGSYLHIHGYGSTNARLDRFQGLEDYSNHQTIPNLRLAIGEAATLGHSRHLSKRMTELWNGRVVYQRHWKSFLDDMRKEWKQMIFFALAIWMACIILVASGRGSTVVFVSAWLAAIAVLLSFHLLQAHAEDQLSTAPGISAWISKVEDLKHGLRPLSITFALPQALSIYAFVSLQLGLVLLFSNADLG
ncbi:hypothetical protein FS837_008700 [Tulasnella sp. UAMH 9824]|nr:hypothetical protein FS837_008700 [Tulasnella sp. UAMH 9824]